MALIYTSDLKAYVLDEGDEPTDGSSDYDQNVITWLDSGYKGIWSGTFELAPEVHYPWWWLWSPMPGVITLNPNINNDVVTITQQTNAGVLGLVPQDVSGNNISIQGWYIKILGSLDVFRVSVHQAGSTNITLDSIFTGPTGTVQYNAFQLEYALPSNLLYIVSPMRAYQTGREQVEIVSKHALETLFPLTQITFGIPNMAALIAEQILRFSHYVGSGQTVTPFVRVDFDYLVIPPDLTGAANEQPLLPAHYRRILTDYALYRLYKAKNDDRAEDAGSRAKSGVQAMMKEHMNRINRGSNSFGRIYPRQQDRASIRGPWRTESGFILSY